MNDSKLLKNLYDKDFFNYLIDKINEVYPEFNSKKFLKDIYISDWNIYELKERYRHITKCLNLQMPKDFFHTSSILVELSNNIYSDRGEINNFMFIFIPDYYELYGLDHYEISINAFVEITKLVSCEFAARAFILKYQDKMMNQLLIWTKNPNHHVRRLASECCRPNLPWAQALPQFRKYPFPILPILENLKSDESEYVRRSVANNLNDLSKTNEDIIVSMLREWYGNNPYTDKLVKHAARTLLKAGHKEIMELFGYTDNPNIHLLKFSIDKKEVKIGEDLFFEIEIFNESLDAIPLRIEYKLYFLKASGKLFPKVFQITEKEFPAGITKIERKQHFKPISTRKYYFGKHKISIIINGIEKAKLTFKLSK